MDWHDGARPIGMRQYGLGVALLGPIGMRQYGLGVALLACANTGSVSPYWHAPIRALVVRCVRAKALSPCFLGVRIRCARFFKALYSGFGVGMRRLMVADIAPIWDRLFPIGFVIRDQERIE